MARTIKNTTQHSKLNICNQALSLIGSERIHVTQAELDSPTINSIGQQADLHYDCAIQELTRMHNWHCCQSLKAADDTEADHAIDSNHLFTDVYVTDVASQRVIRIGTDTSTSLQPKHDFIVISDEDDNSSDTSLVINTDLAPGTGTGVVVKYLEVPSAANMDSQFAGCLRTYLASKLAIPVAGNVNRKFELLKYLYEKQLPEAKRSNALEGTQDYVNASFEETSLNPFTYKPILKA
tara:strand:+ start:518 stop:1228 length:711 start_codon:yes stop_codon:yes gene_type:complete